jgi:transcriptional repressor NrdR
MQCPSCKYPDLRVVWTRQNDFKNQTERRRECLKCAHRFTTQENLRADKDNVK